MTTANGIRSTAATRPATVAEAPDITTTRTRQADFRTRPRFAVLRHALTSTKNDSGTSGTTADTSGHITPYGRTHGHTVRTMERHPYIFHINHGSTPGHVQLPTSEHVTRPHPPPEDTPPRSDRHDVTAARSDFHRPGTHTAVLMATPGARHDFHKERPRPLQAITPATMERHRLLHTANVPTSTRPPLTRPDTATFRARYAHIVRGYGHTYTTAQKSPTRAFPVGGL